MIILWLFMLKLKKKNVFHWTDGRSTQNYSSEPHKIQNKKIQKKNVFHRTDGRSTQNYSSEPHKRKYKTKKNFFTDRQKTQNYSSEPHKIFFIGFC